MRIYRPHITKIVEVNGKKGRSQYIASLHRFICWNRIRKEAVLIASDPAYINIRVFIYSTEKGVSCPLRSPLTFPKIFPGDGVRGQFLSL